MECYHLTFKISTKLQFLILEKTNSEKIAVILIWFW